MKNTKNTVTWALIANGTRARFLELTGAKAEPIELAGEELSWDHKKAKDLMADRPGRTQESVGAARHAVGAHTDPEREHARQFALHIAARLERALSDGLYQALLVVAAPALLGDLRASMSDPVRKTITGEYAKDLTHLPIRELKDQVRSLIR